MENLILGDCLTEISKLDEVDISFTSPPYNRKRNDKYRNYDDSIDDYYKFLCQFTDLLLSKTNKYTIINVQKSYYNKVDVFRYIGHYADKIQEIIIWEKSNPLPASAHNITNAYEFFIVLGDIPLKSNYTYTKNHITTAVNSETNTDTHKAVMKQEVADWFIEKFTSEGDTVLDCFMGLGTPGISCKKLNRNFIGIEVNETYFNEAKRRIGSANTDGGSIIKVNGSVIQRIQKLF